MQPIGLRTAGDRNRQRRLGEVRHGIINFETSHLDVPARDRCRSTLAKTGYSFLEVGRDTLALRED